MPGPSWHPDIALADLRVRQGRAMPRPSSSARIRRCRRCSRRPASTSSRGPRPRPGPRCAGGCGHPGRPAPSRRAAHRARGRRTGGRRPRRRRGGVCGTGGPGQRSRRPGPPGPHGRRSGSCAGGDGPRARGRRARRGHRGRAGCVPAAMAAGHPRPGAGPAARRGGQPRWRHARGQGGHGSAGRPGRRAERTPTPPCSNEEPRHQRRPPRHCGATGSGGRCRPEERVLASPTRRACTTSPTSSPSPTPNGTCSTSSTTSRGWRRRGCRSATSVTPAR